jgi:dephospho-CoA kinase
MIIGLTGGIGSGKSAAADYFIDLGIDVIDADIVAKNVLSINSNGYNLFVKDFGEEFLNDNKEVNRELLRKEIFSDEIKKKRLENIVHPNVRSNISDFINNSRSPYCIIMVPLIFETNSSKNYDRILVIDCDVETQIQRSALRDNQSIKEIKKIIHLQASRDQRLSIADDVISNISTLTNLKAEILKLHDKYMEIINNG